MQPRAIFVHLQPPTQIFNLPIIDVPRANVRIPRILKQRPVGALPQFCEHSPADFHPYGFNMQVKKGCIVGCIMLLAYLEKAQHILPQNLEQFRTLGVCLKRILEYKDTIQSQNMNSSHVMEAIAYFVAWALCTIYIPELHVFSPGSDCNANAGIALI